MRVLAILTIVVLLFGLAAADVQDGKINLSGTWTLNADKSETGGGGRGGRGRRGFGASKMVIEQKGDQLIVESFRLNRDGEEVSTKVTYTLNGKKTTIETRRGSAAAIAKWGKDGKTITITTERSFSRGERDFTMTTTQTWSLKDGSLVIDSVMSTPRGDREIKTVYDKAEK